MTGAEISEILGMPLATVHAVLKRVGLGRLSRLDPAEPANRYQRRWPGELLHIDVKKLARIDGVGHAMTGTRKGQKRRKGARRVGYEYVHVCVDDATRLAYVEVLANEQATTAIGFLQRCLAFFAARGVRVERVMTDNGSAYRSMIWAIAAAPWAYATCAPGHADHAPTARPNASSAPCWAAGPTPRSTPPAATAPTPCPPGSTTTITDDHTAASPTSHLDTD
jgi:integrase-like protein